MTMSIKRSRSIALSSGKCMITGQIDLFPECNFSYFKIIILTNFRALFTKEQPKPKPLCSKSNHSSIFNLSKHEHESSTSNLPSNNSSAIRSAKSMNRVKSLPKIRYKDSTQNVVQIGYDIFNTKMQTYNAVDPKYVPQIRKKSTAYYVSKKLTPFKQPSQLTSPPFNNQVVSNSLRLDKVYETSKESNKSEALHDGKNRVTHTRIEMGQESDTQEKDYVLETSENHISR